MMNPSPEKYILPATKNYNYVETQAKTNILMSPSNILYNFLDVRYLNVFSTIGKIKHCVLKQYAYLAF